MHKYFLSLLMLLIIPLFVYGQDMDQDSNDANYKSAYKTVLNALTSGKLDGLDKYVASNMIEHDSSPVMSKKTGIERINDDFAAYHKIFLDMKAEVHGIAVSGDYLFAYITFTGTTSEPYMGMPANQKMTMNQVDLIRFNEGKIAEHWGFTSNEDLMKMMPQNGMGDK